MTQPLVRACSGWIPCLFRNKLHTAKQQLHKFRIQITCNFMMLSFDTYLGIAEGAWIIVLDYWGINVPTSSCATPREHPLRSESLENSIKPFNRVGFMLYYYVPGLFWACSCFSFIQSFLTWDVCHPMPSCFPFSGSYLLLVHEEQV